MSAGDVILRLATTGAATVANDVRAVGGNLDGLKGQAQQLGDTAGRIGDKLRNMLAGLGLALTVKEFVEASDAMSLMAGRLKLATSGSTEFAKAQSDIYAIAQANNVGLQETTALYTRLAGPVKTLGGTTREVGAIVDAFATSLRVGGASTQEASAATLQFAQAMGSGKLQGDEFRSIAEASPRFMKALADGMGLPVDALKKLGTEGKLTADVVGNALIKSLGKLKDEAKALPDTVGGAMTRLKNDTLLAVDEINRSSGITLGLAELVGTITTELLPVIKTELADAFKSVGQLIGEHRDKIVEVWGVVKALVGDVWQVAKAAAGVVGFVVDLVAQAGLLKIGLEVARLLLAGLRDGVEIIAASLAHVGSQILQFLVTPLRLGGELAAVIAGVFDAQLGAKIKATVDSITAFAKAGEGYAASVTMRFAEGDSAVASLGRQMAKSKADADQLSKALAGGSVSAADGARELRGMQEKAAGAAGAFVQLKGATTASVDATEAATKKSREQQDLLLSLSGVTKDHGKNVADLTAMYHRGGVTQETYLRLMDEELAKQPVVIKGKKDHADAVKLSEKALFDLAAATVDGIGKEAAKTAEIVKGNAALADEVDKLTLTKEQLLAKHLANVQEQIDELEMKVAREGATAQLLDQIQALKDRQVLLKDKSGAEAAKAEGDAWGETAKQIGQSLSDSLMAGGKSGWDYIKGLFRNMLIKVPLQAVMTSVVGSVGGMLGLSGSANAAGSTGGGALGNLGSLGSLGSMLSGAGALAGNGVLASLTGTGLGSSLAASSAMISGGSTAAGIGYGLGAAAPYLAAAAVVYKLLTADHNAKLGYGSAKLGAGGTVTDPGRLLDFGRGTDIGSQDQLVSIARAVLGGTANTATLLGGSLGTGMSVQAMTDMDQQGKGAGSIQWFGAGNSRLGGVQTGGTNALTAGAAKLDDAGKLGDWFAANTSAAIVAGLQQSDLPSRFRAYFGGVAAYGLSQADAEAMLATAGSVKSLTDALLPMGGVFGQLGSMSVEATAGLAQLTGGFDAFLAKSAQYVKDYYSEGEQMAISAAQVQATLKAAGVDAGGLSSRADFRALVDASNLSTTGGQQQLAALLNVSQQFASVADYLGTTGQSLAQLADTAPQVALLEQAQSQTEIAQQTVDGIQTLTDGVAAIGNQITGAIATMQGVVEAALVAVALGTAETTRQLNAWDDGGRLFTVTGDAAP